MNNQQSSSKSLFLIICFFAFTSFGAAPNVTAKLGASYDSTSTPTGESNGAIGATFWCSARYITAPEVPQVPSEITRIPIPDFSGFIHGPVGRITNYFKGFELTFGIDVEAFYPKQPDQKATWVVGEATRFKLFVNDLLIVNGVCDLEPDNFSDDGIRRRPAYIRIDWDAPSPVDKTLTLQLIRPNSPSYELSWTYRIQEDIPQRDLEQLIGFRLPDDFNFLRGALISYVDSTTNATLDYKMLVKMCIPATDEAFIRFWERLTAERLLHLTLTDPHSSGYGVKWWDVRNYRIGGYNLAVSDDKLYEVDIDKSSRNEWFMYLNVSHWK